MSNKTSLRADIIEHLTEWFRDLGVETHQIENSADEIMRLVIRSLPRELPKVCTKENCPDFECGYNQMIKDFKQTLQAGGEATTILKGGE
jgi:hypothetical protein